MSISARAPRRGLDVGFELTNLCNLHCTHCIRGSHQEVIDRLDLSLVESILDQAIASFSPVEVVFTGGEPLAADLFPAAVDALRVRGLGYRFVTNGWLIPRQMPTILAHRPRFVRVSLSGGTEATHDAIRGRGSFRRALLGAAALRSRDIRTDLSLVITRESRHELADAVRLAAALAAGELHYIFSQPTPESAANGSDLSPNEWREAMPEIGRIAAVSPVPVIVDYGAHLPVPRHSCDTLTMRSLYVDAQGRVPFCCQLSRYGSGPDPIIGDLTRERVADVVARMSGEYEAFGAETNRRHAAGEWDELDEFPCMSCARRHGKTGFLAAFPEHPWTGLGSEPARHERMLPVVA